jgi:hypothetical protein
VAFDPDSDHQGDKSSLPHEGIAQLENDNIFLMASCLGFWSSGVDPHLLGAPAANRNEPPICLVWFSSLPMAAEQFKLIIHRNVAIYACASESGKRLISIKEIRVEKSRTDTRRKNWLLKILCQGHLNSPEE